VRNGILRKQRAGVGYFPCRRVQGRANARNRPLCNSGRQSVGAGCERACRCAAWLWTSS
jgi:hypothetical protein